MAYDPVLAERVHAAIAKDTGVRERKMFGGLAFLLNGNFAVSAYKDGGEASDLLFAAPCSGRLCSALNTVRDSEEADISEVRPGRSPGSGHRSR